MKKASFFIVLGLAVLLLFGCAGGGGPLGGVSTKPVDTWFVEVLEHYMTSSGKPQYNQSYNEYIKIEVVDNAYHAKAVGEDGVELSGIDVTFDFSNDKVNSLKIKKDGEYDYNLTGEFYDGSSKDLDVMFGTYSESIESEEGHWFAFRKDSSTLTGVSTSEGAGDNLKQLETIIEGLIKETTGEEVEIDLSELMK